MEYTLLQNLVASPQVYLAGEAYKFSIEQSNFKASISEII